MRRTTEKFVHSEKGATRRTSIRRTKPSLIPSERQLSKKSDEKCLTMEKKAASEAETVLHYAIPLKTTESRFRAETTRNEMRQIQNKLNEYVKNLEAIYDESNEEKTKEASSVEKPLSSFLSACDSAASELDITNHAEYQILESLQLWYGKEVQLLEQLIEADMTGDNAPASPETIAALFNQVTHILHKLNAIKKQLQDFRETLFRDPPPEPVSQIKTEKMGMRMQLHRAPQIKNVDSQGTQNVVTKLQGLINSKDSYSSKALEKIIQDVGERFKSQEDEFQKLEKEHKETEQKYTKIKAEYQLLLEEKNIIENELKQILQLKVGQKHASSVPVKTEYKPDQVMLTKPQAVTADGQQQVLLSKKSETFPKQADDTKMEESQKEPSSSGGLPLKSVQKKSNLEQKRDLAKMYSNRNQDQGTVNKVLDIIAPANAETKSDRPHSKTRSPLATVEEEITEGNGKKVYMVTQKVKSATGQKKRPSTTPAKATAVTGADNMTSHINQLSVIPGITPTDSSHAENMIQEKAKTLTDGSLLGTDTREQSTEDKAKPKSDLVYEIGLTNFRAQPDRVTKTSDSSEQPRISIAINKLLNPQSEGIHTEQKPTPNKQTANKEEGQGALEKTQVLKDSPTKQENEQLEHVTGSSMTPTFVTTEKERLLSTEFNFPQTPVHKQDTSPGDFSGHYTSTIQYIFPSAGPAKEIHVTNTSLSDVSTDTLRCPRKISQEHMPSGVSEIHPQLQVRDLGRTQLSDGAIKTTQAPPEINEMTSQQQFSRDGEIHQILLQESQKTPLSTTLIATKKQMPSMPSIGEICSEQQIFRDEENQLILLGDSKKSQLCNSPITIQTSVAQQAVEKMSQKQFLRDGERHNVSLTESWDGQISIAPMTTQETAPAEVGSQEPLSIDNESYYVSLAEPCSSIQISTEPKTIQKTISAEVRSQEPLSIDDESHYISVEEPCNIQLSTAPRTIQKTVPAEVRSQEPLSINDETNFISLAEPCNMQLSTAPKTIQKTIPAEVRSHEPLSIDEESHYTSVAESCSAHISTAPKTKQKPVNAEVRSQEPLSIDESHYISVAEPFSVHISTALKTKQKPVLAEIRPPEPIYRDGEGRSILLGEPQKTQMSTAPITAVQIQLPSEITGDNLPHLLFIDDKSQCFLPGKPETKQFSDEKRQVFDSPVEGNLLSQYIKVGDPLRTHLRTTDFTTTQGSPKVKTPSLPFSRDVRNLGNLRKTQMSTSFHTKKRHSTLQSYRVEERISYPFTVPIHKSPNGLCANQTQNSNSHLRPIIYVSKKSIFEPQKGVTGKGSGITDSADYEKATETQEKAAEGTKSRPHKPPVLISSPAFANSGKDAILHIDLKEEMTKQQFPRSGGEMASSSDFTKRTQQQSLGRTVLQTESWKVHHRINLPQHYPSDPPVLYNKDFQQDYCKSVYMKGTSRQCTQRTEVLNLTIKQPDKRAIKTQFFSLQLLEEIGTSRPITKQPDNRILQGQPFRLQLLEETAHERSRKHCFPRANTPFLSGPLTARDSYPFFGSMAWKDSTVPRFLVNGVERSVLVDLSQHI